MNRLTIIHRIVWFLQFILLSIQLIIRLSIFLTIVRYEFVNRHLVYNLDHLAINRTLDTRDCE